MSDLSNRSHYHPTPIGNEVDQPNGFKTGMKAKHLDDTLRVQRADLTKWWQRQNHEVTVGGTADAITLNYDVNPEVIVEGEVFTFKATATNTGPATIKIGTLDPISLTAPDGSLLRAGDITAGEFYSVTFDGASYRVLIPSYTNYVNRHEEQTIGGAKTFTDYIELPENGANNNLRLRFGNDQLGMFGAGARALWVTVSGVNAARFDPVGPATAADQSIITREKGDARYAQLGVDNTFSGVNTFGLNDLVVARGYSSVAAGLQFGDNGTGGVYGFSMGSSGDQFIFTMDGAFVAQIDAAGTDVPSTRSVITREKGDVRYAQLGEINTFNNYAVFKGNISIENSAARLSLTDTDTGVIHDLSGNSSVGSLFLDVDQSGGGTDPKFYIRYGAAKTTAAQFDEAGAGVSDPQTVITREKGDGRYVQLEADNTLSGALTSLSSIKASRGVSDQFIEFTGGDASGTILRFNSPAGNPKVAIVKIERAAGDAFQPLVFDETVGGVSTRMARIDRAGTIIPTDETIITREKGDARYAQLNAANTFNFNLVAPSITLDNSASFTSPEPDTHGGFNIASAVTGHAVRITPKDAAGSNLWYAALRFDIHSQKWFIGSTYSDANSIIRQSDGDVRYQPINSGIVNGVRIQSTTPRIFWNQVGSTDNSYYIQNILSGSGYQFVENGGEVARITARNTSLASPVEVVTREKGDARYTQLSAINTFNNIQIIALETPVETSSSSVNRGSIMFLNDSTPVQNGLIGGISFAGFSGGRRRAGIYGVQTGVEDTKVGIDFYTYSGTTISQDAVYRRMRIDHNGSLYLGSSDIDDNLVLNRAGNDARYAQLSEENTFTKGQKITGGTWSGNLAIELNGTDAMTGRPAISFRPLGLGTADERNWRIIASGTAPGPLTVQAMLDDNITADTGTYSFQRKLPTSNADLGINDVLTRRGGDYRYAQLGAENTFSEKNTFGLNNLVVSRGYSSSVAGIRFGSNGTGGPYGISSNSDGDRFIFAMDGSFVAYLEPFGTDAPDERSLITRQKGDARYAKTGDITGANGSLLVGTGTGTPLGELHVAGSTPTICIQDTDSNGVAATGLIEWSDNAATPIGSIGYAGPTDLRLFIRNNFDFNILFTVDGLGAAEIENVNGNLNSSLTVVTRSKGDSRYSLASSGMKYKSDVTERSVDLSAIKCKQFTWGGELPEDDPRRGTIGVGLIADEVAEVFPEAVTYDEQGRPEGLNALALIGALIDKVNKLEEQLKG